MLLMIKPELTKGNICQIMRGLLCKKAAVWTELVARVFESGSLQGGSAFLQPGLAVAQ